MTYTVSSEAINSAPANDKLQDTVSTYLWGGGVVNRQIKKGLLLRMSVENFIKFVHIWQSYKQERGCLVYVMRLATTLLKDKTTMFLLVTLSYIHRLKNSLADSAVNLS